MSLAILFRAVRNARDAAARFRVSVLIYRDAQARATVTARSYRDAAARAVVQVRSFRDTSARFRVVARVFKDATARATVTVRSYRDASSRTVVTVRSYRDIAIRVRVIAPATRDAVARARVTAAASRDAGWRFMVVVPTRLFLRDVTSALAPSNGTKSAVLPVVAATSNSGAGYEDLSLLGTKGALQVTRSITADVNTNHQDQYIARFTSPPLADGVIPAQTWRLGIAMSEGDAAADSYLVISLYVWRPGTSSVVGYIRDSDSPLGVEWSATEDGQVVQFSGLAVTGQEDDVVVLEAWRHKAAA